MKYKLNNMELIIKPLRSGSFLFEERCNGRPVYGIICETIIEAIEKLHEAAFDYIF